MKRSALFLFLTLFSGSCVSSMSETELYHARQDDRLYDALGGTPGIAVIVESFLGFIADDIRIVEIFADANIENLRSQLITQFCDLSGGPCEYTGLSMAEAHADMEIGQAEFNALVEDLQKALEKHEIPVWAQNELIALLAPMRDDVIRGSSARK